MSKITNLENIDVWKTKSDFNYDVWSENVVVKLCNVNWDRTKNVVAFESVAERKKYFEKLDGFVVDQENLLNSVNRILNTQTTRVEIPFSELNFNYIAVFSQDLPVTKNQETKPDSFFFIQDAKQVAPSTTELTLALDTWTTHQFDVEISRGKYERGHHKISEVTVDNLFDANFDRLDSDLNTLEEPIVINSRKVGGSKIVPIAKGEAYLCIMSTAFLAYPWTQDENLPKIPCEPVVIDNGIANAMKTYAVRRADIETLRQNAPKQFWKSVKGAFYASRDWLTFGSARPFGGVTVHDVANDDGLTKTIKEISFSKNDFGFDSKYAKAYTSQFAPIDIMRGSEFVGTIGIESFNKLKLGISSNTIFPFVKIEAMLTGLNANGSSSFNWSRLDYDRNTELENSDWRQFLFDLNIPVFAMAENPVDAWDYDERINNHNKYINRDITRDIAYRSARTGRDNSNASNEMGNANAHRSIQTTRDNANASNNTGNANANRSIDTTKKIGDRNKDFAHESTVAGIKYDNEMKDHSQYWRNVEIKNEERYLSDDYNFSTGVFAGEIAAGMGTKWLSNVTTTAIQNSKREQLASPISSNQVAKPQQADVDTSATVATSDGGGSGATTAGGDFAGLAAYAVQMASQIPLSLARLNHSNGLNKLKLHNTRTNFNSMTDDGQKKTTSFNNSQNNKTKEISASNNNDSFNTSKANQSASYGTTAGTITKSFNTSTVNQNASYSTSAGNITRSYDTSIANADDNYRRVGLDVKYARANAGMQTMIERGSNSGDHFQYTTGRLAYQFIVRKPDRKSLQNLEQMFDNYGYTWNEYVDSINVFVDREKFNFWQISDVVLKSTNIKNSYIENIKQMFADGVRVWRVGKI